MPEEVRKEIAATTDGNEPPKDSNIFLYLLQRMDSMEGNLRSEIRSLREENELKFNKFREENELKFNKSREENELKFNKLDEKIDSVHRELYQELHSMTRWIIGSILTAIGVAIAAAAWLIG